MRTKETWFLVTLPSSIVSSSSLSSLSMLISSGLLVLVSSPNSSVVVLLLEWTIVNLMVMLCKLQQVQYLHLLHCDDQTCHHHTLFKMSLKDVIMMIASHFCSTGIGDLVWWACLIAEQYLTNRMPLSGLGASLTASSASARAFSSNLCISFFSSSEVK